MILTQLLAHPTEAAALVRLAFAARSAEKAASTADRFDDKLSTDDSAKHATASSATSTSPSLERCYYFLERTSRSFATVIRALHPELRVAVAIFYLVLRALDTIEDDMSLHPLSRKRQLLRDFYMHIDEPGYTFCENGLTEPDRDLLVEFACVVDEFRALRCEYQVVIRDITMRMGAGMAEYAEGAYAASLAVASAKAAASAGQDIDMMLDQGKPAATTTTTIVPADARVERITDYNTYCYYVAGLVGHGLTRLFVASGLESPSLLNVIPSTHVPLATESSGKTTMTAPATAYPLPTDPSEHPGVDLANEMGLFLQKVNITRDFQEDLGQGRVFWPHEIWGQYVDRVEDLTTPFKSGYTAPAGKRLVDAQNTVTTSDGYSFARSWKKTLTTALGMAQSLSCLNHMCANALELVPSVLRYLEQLQEPTVFRFCAIPQVMAIATFVEVFNNPQVFTRVVKIRKGLAAKLILGANDLASVKRVFADLARTARAKNCRASNTLMYDRVEELCQLIELLCNSPLSPDIVLKQIALATAAAGPTTTRAMTVSQMHRVQAQRHLQKQLKRTVLTALGVGVPAGVLYWTYVKHRDGTSVQLLRSHVVHSTVVTAALAAVMAPVDYVRNKLA
ncbi:bifunctional farnesyl-diphosphate farnesyltransferase/squalene synthase [Sorochytrium milnesiophthora]